MKTVFAALCAGLALAGICEDDIYVGTGETVRREIDSDAEQSGKVVISPRGTLLKTGGGVWTLPTSKITQGWGANIAVGQGTMRIRQNAASATGGSVAAPQVLQNAAVWFDARKADSFVHDDSGRIVDWLDCRETGNASDGYALVRAHTDSSFSTLAPELKEKGGTTGLYFQGFGSGCWMNLLSAGGAQAEVLAKNVFVVQGQFEKLAPLLGVRSGYRNGSAHLAFVPGLAQSGAFLPMWVNANYDVSSILAARTYIDGDEVDAFSSTSQTFPSNRFALVEVEFLETAGGFQCFFNDRDYFGGAAGNRVGGEYICEVVAFTNVLSASERLLVEGYLMSKWFGVKHPTALHVTAANGARVEMESVGDGAETIPVSMGGGGDFVKVGSNEDDIGIPTLLEGFNGRFRLEDGVIRTRGSVPFAVAAGERLHVDLPYGGPVMSNAVAEADSFVKSGAGALRINALPSAVKRLRVSEGELTLEAPAAVAAPISASSSVVTGYVPNASFEQGIGATTSTEDLGENGFQGWAAVAGEGSSDANLAWVNHSAYNGGKNAASIYWKLPTEVPDGECVLAINKGASVWTTITLPQDGVYELTFKAASRIDKAGLILDLAIGESIDAATSFGSFRSVYADGRFCSFRYRLPHLGAGSHRLWFRQVDVSKDSCCLIDDLKLTRVDDALLRQEVPNGSFEQFRASYDAFTKPMLFDSTNFDGLASWTVVQAAEESDGANYGWALASHIGSGPVVRGMGWDNRTSDKGWASQFCNVRECDDGFVQLYLTQGASAHVMFTPAAGRYFVSADIGLYRSTFDSSPHMAAHSYVKIGDADYVSLGDIDINGEFSMKCRTFPLAFTVDGQTAITLRLAATMAPTSYSYPTGHLLFDNVRLVPVGEGKREELVMNGSFTAASGWEYVKGEGLADNFTPRRLECVNASNAYGANWIDNHALVVIDNGLVHQDVAVPAVGWYRLSLAARTRVWFDGTPRTPLPVRFWLAKDGVTNVIANLTPPVTNFTMWSWSFRMPEAGAWKFGIEGLGVGGNDLNTLIDNVSLVYDPNVGDTPDIGEDVEIFVDEGAKMRLDFPGTGTVSRLKINGRSRYGLVRASDFPDVLSGDGTFFVLPPKGMTVIIR